MTLWKAESNAHLLSSAFHGLEGGNPLVHTINKVAQECQCPISHDLPYDPVIATDGQVYERIAIKQWMQENKESPVTREELGTALVPAKHIINIITSLLESNVLTDYDPIASFLRYKNTHLHDLNTHIENYRSMLTAKVKFPVEMNEQRQLSPEEPLYKKLRQEINLWNRVMQFASLQPPIERNDYLTTLREALKLVAGVKNLEEKNVRFEHVRFLQLQTSAPKLLQPFVVALVSKLNELHPDK